MRDSYFHFLDDSFAASGHPEHSPYRFHMPVYSLKKFHERFKSGRKTLRILFISLLRGGISDDSDGDWHCRWALNIASPAQRDLRPLTKLYQPVTRAATPLSLATRQPLGASYATSAQPHHHSARQRILLCGITPRPRLRQIPRPSYHASPCHRQCARQRYRRLRHASGTGNANVIGRHFNTA
jgi:hypothetical protein